MELGNVLVIGNSGVGKSTLINAVLGEDKAVTGWGNQGTTDKLEIYESKQIPFRVIDTIGFEPTFFKEQKAINAVKKWSKESAKKGKENNQINCIWFCVDGTSRKLFSKTVESLSRATSIWKSVPIIAVITKSYSEKERKENIEMVYNAFAKSKRKMNLKKVIPVVASTYEITDTVFAPPVGITELIDITNELLPEGIRSSSKDIAQYNLNRKRVLAHTIVASSTVSAVAIGAIPTSFADALLLAPLEVAEINSIAWIYGIRNDDKAKQFIESIKDVGTVSVAAKAAISALKNIPGINIGATVLNAIIAGSIVAAIGEGTTYAFEQVYLGNKTLEDIEWLKKTIESKLSGDFITKVKNVILSSNNKLDKKAIVQLILELFSLIKK